MRSKDDVNDGDGEDDDDNDNEDEVNRTVVQQLVQATVHQAQHDYKDAGMGWFHLTCTYSDSDARYAKKNTIWTCPTCRAIPSTLSALQVNVKSVMALLR